MIDKRQGRWYLVYTKPRQETVARRNLERQGYVTYLPRIRQSRRRQGRMVASIAPMFPRYLFIRLSEETDNWGPIRSTLGVVSLVRFGHTPAPVPDAFIDELHSREDDEGIQVLPLEQYHSGAKVRITEGGLAGYEAIYLARSGRDRVTILLQLLGREARATVDLTAIEPAG